MEFGVWCLVFGVWCLVFGVWGLGFVVCGLGLRLRSRSRIYSLEFRVQGFKAKGFELRVWGVSRVV